MNGTPLIFRHVEKDSSVFAGWREDAPPHPGGNADDCQNKGVARKAICKTMKTKGEQNEWQREQSEKVWVDALDSTWKITVDRGNCRPGIWRAGI